MTIRTFATPLTIASFITVGITGILMLFGSHGGLIKTVHEVSSVIFVLGSGLHILVNLKPTLMHLKRPLGATLALVFLAASLAALIPFESQKGNPRRAFMQATEVLLNLNPQQIAGLTQQSPEQVINDLKRSGFQVSEGATLKSIARASGREPFDVIAVATRNVAVSDRH